MIRQLFERPACDNFGHEVCSTTGFEKTAGETGSRQKFTSAAQSNNQSITNVQTGSPLRPGLVLVCFVGNLAREPIAQHMVAAGHQRRSPRKGAGARQPSCKLRQSARGFRAPGGLIHVQQCAIRCSCACATVQRCRCKETARNLNRNACTCTYQGAAPTTPTYAVVSTL